MEVEEYEFIGKYIYGLTRLGAEMADLENWMADDLGIARPVASSEHVFEGGVYQQFVAKYSTPEARKANFDRFMESLRARQG